MLRMTSKRIKDAIDKIRPPTEVILNMNFWSDIRNGNCTVSDNEKLEFIMRQLISLVTTCQITRLELPCCNMSIQLERFKKTLAQCKSLTNLNLYNNNLGATGVISLIGVLGQCSVLNLAHNNIDTEGATRLVDVLT
jgi:hypothetical protein